jgi:polyphenol oxidase
MSGSAGELSFFQFPSFDPSRVRHAITTRQGGVSEPPYDTLNLALSVEDDPDRVRENRRRVAERLSATPEQLVNSRQVHGSAVLVVDERFDPDAPLPDADAQVTDRPDWLLSLRFADCVPMLFWHTSRPVVGAAHAGWRGTLAGVGPTTVDALHERYAADPGGLRVGIGPSIGPCCYEVGEEVAAQFAAWPDAVLRGRGPRPYLDLWAINRQRLESAGVPATAIDVAGVCTRCHADRFFSHRVMGYPAGRFGALIGLVG